MSVENDQRIEKPQYRLSAAGGGAPAPGGGVLAVDARTRFFDGALAAVARRKPARGLILKSAGRRS